MPTKNNRNLVKKMLPKISVLSEDGCGVLRLSAELICKAVLDGKTVIGWQNLAPDAVGILTGARLNSKQNGIIGIFRGPFDQVVFSPAYLKELGNDSVYANRYSNLFHVYEAPIHSAKTSDGRILYSEEMLSQEDQSELLTHTLRCKCKPKCPIHDREEAD